MTTTEAAVEAATKQYLSNMARNMWIYESNDLAEGTLSGYMETRDVSAVADSDDPIVVSESELSKYDAGISFVENKAEYFKEMRESQNIQRDDFSLDYSLMDMGIDRNTATVKMCEFISFHYPDFPDVLSEVVNFYTVTLVNIDDTWLVADVTSDNDPFDEMYKALGFDASNPEATFSKIVNDTDAEYIESIKSVDEISDEEVMPAATTSTLYYYIGSNAAAYAYTYATSKYNAYDTHTAAQAADARTYWNANFWKDNSNDCMNFASQSIWAGFGGSNEKSKIYNSRATVEHAAPMDTTGTWKWYGTTPEGGESTKAVYWTSCSYFRDYIKGEEKTSMPDFYATHDSITGSQGFSSITSQKSDLIGAVLHVNSLKHAVIVTDANGFGRDQVLFTAHTSDRKGVKVGEYYGSGEIYVIIPERIRVYNPEEVRISATLQRPFASGSTLTLKSSVNATCSEITMTVKKENTVVATETVKNKSVITDSVKFSSQGLYTITTTAKKTSTSTPVTYVYTVRTY